MYKSVRCDGTQTLHHKKVAPETLKDRALPLPLPIIVPAVREEKLGNVCLGERGPKLGRHNRSNLFSLGVKSTRTSGGTRGGCERSKGEAGGVDEVAGQQSLVVPGMQSAHSVTWGQRKRGMTRNKQYRLCGSSTSLFLSGSIERMAAIPPPRTTPAEANPIKQR